MSTETPEKLTACEQQVQGFLRESMVFRRFPHDSGHALSHSFENLESKSDGLGALDGGGRPWVELRFVTIAPLCPPWQRGDRLCCDRRSRTSPQTCSPVCTRLHTIAGPRSCGQAPGLESRGRRNIVRAMDLV